MGEFGVRVFDERVWIDSNFTFTTDNLEGGGFILDEILSWSESDSSIEVTGGSVSKNLGFLLGFC